MLSTRAGIAFRATAYGVQSQHNTRFVSPAPAVRRFRVGSAPTKNLNLDGNLLLAPS